MTPPYPTPGTKLKIEAVITGLEQSDGLNLEFWADTPSGEFFDLARIETKALAPGEKTKYTTEITPKEEGYYTIHGYLYDDNQRIDHEKEVLWVQQ
jgi:hypothetical protein